MDLHIHIHHEGLDGVNQKLDQLLTQGDRTMATLQEVRDELTAIKAAVDAAKISSQAQIDQIAALKAQIAAGSPVSQADLDALDEQADSILAALAPPA